MAGGAYVALSGLRSRADHLDRLASDLANAGTSGYKAERGTTTAAERQMFDRLLDSAIDVAPGPSRMDFRPGVLAPTGRDLDLALRGPGFFVIDTPAGARYTRNGHFERRADGTLTTADGDTVAGENGPIRLGTGPVSIAQDGTVRAGATIAGKLKIVDFADYETLAREGSARFRADGVATIAAPNTLIEGGTLEKSNVSVVDRIAEMTEVSRTFEALQRGVTLLMNDIDGKAITELGRR
jgi:flagellar basal-body rod protein FlgF/flagellar basal-body rod protein FlgG